MFNLTEKILEAMRNRNQGWIPATEGPDIDIRYGCTGGCGGNPCTSSCKGSCKNSCTRNCRGNSR